MGGGDCVTQTCVKVVKFCGVLVWVQYRQQWRRSRKDRSTTRVSAALLLPESSSKKVFMKNLCNAAKKTQRRSWSETL